MKNVKLYEKQEEKITAITFIPYKILENKDMAIEEQRLKKQVFPSWTLNKNILVYLAKYGFISNQIKSHIELLKTAQNTLNMI